MPFDSLLTDNLNRLWASLIVHQLLELGIDHFFISPGLRNVPLVAAVLGHPSKKIRIFTGIDERGEAYRALGYAKNTGRPGVLISTSGTAATNYFPAVIEANKSQTPLVVISCDRSPSEVANGDNQAIDQNNIYGQFVIDSYDFGCPTYKLPPQKLINNLTNIIKKAQENYQGPIHINLPFAPPLTAKKEVIDQDYLRQAYDVIQPHFSDKDGDSCKSIDHFWIDLLKNSKKGLMVIGNLPNHQERDSIIKLLESSPWPIMLDITSSLKFSFTKNKTDILPSLEHQESMNYLKQNPPDVILHLGKRLTGKRYYQFLIDHPEIKLISVQKTDLLEDPSGQSNVHIKCYPNRFAKILLDNEIFSKNSSQDQKLFKQYDNIAGEDKFVKAIVDLIAENSTLYLGNSLTVRLFDKILPREQTKNLEIVTNRGASGIEGFIASTIGVAIASKKRTTLVIGDIAFYHDLNSLLMLKDANRPLTIIIFNNHGGGIFSNLPIAKEREVLELISTPHNRNFKGICEYFNLSYQLTNTLEQFKKAYTKAQNSNQHQIIEININSKNEKL